MPTLLYVYLTAACAWEAVNLYLLQRQATCVIRNRNHVPADFACEVTLAEHQKAADYTVAKVKLSASKSVTGLSVSFGIVLGGLDLLSGAISNVAASPLRDVLILGIVTGLSALIGLPLSLYGDLVIEERFGFNRRTLRLFILDKLKSIAISVVLGAPLLLGLFWAMHHLNSFWWLYVWIALVAIMLVAPTVYTRLIAPMFNKFEPLQDREMRLRVEELMERCGFKASGLFTMDASKRTSHGNAYFIGFGRTKRIVLFDTLLNSQTPDEVNAVLAHELGHFKYKHTLFGMLRGIAILFAMLATFGWLCKQPWLLPLFGFEHVSDAASLIAANLLLSVVEPLLSPISNWISRRHEFQADEFARRMVGVEPMVSALTKLSRDNASTLTPDPLFALATYSHPPVPVRIAHLQVA